MNSTSKRLWPPFSVRTLLYMILAAGLIWQASFVWERKAVLARAFKSQVRVEFRGEPSFLRSLMGDLIVWSFSIPPESEFYGHTADLRRAFPEAYINHMAGPIMVEEAMANPGATDTPPNSPPLRSAWWGF